MTGTIRSIAMLGAVLALFAQPAIAEDEFGGPGAYLGGAFALGFDNFDTSGTPFNSDGTGTGVDVWAGFRLAQFLALEGQYQWIPGMKIGGSEFKPMTYTANAKVFLPIGRFQPYGLIGIGGMTIEGPGGNSTSDYATRFGAGLDFWLTQQLALVATWNYMMGSGSVEGFDFNSLSFGATFKF